MTQHTVDGYIHEHMNENALEGLVKAKKIQQRIRGCAVRAETIMEKEPKQE